MARVGVWLTLAAGPLIVEWPGRKLVTMAATLPEKTESDAQQAAVVARRGDSEQARLAACDAFEGLYRRYAPLLLAFFASRVRASERDDLHQEVWQRVWHHLPDQFRGGNFRAWLHQIARHAIIDQGRKRRSEPLIAQEALPDPHEEPSDHRMIQNERKQALERCLELLGPDGAALLRARLAGEDYPEICQRLKLEPARAYKLFHSAKEQLKTCVEQTLG
jgi:RNA polymerase sigma factor (sigma-70 family)